MKILATILTHAFTLLTLHVTMVRSQIEGEAKAMLLDSMEWMDKFYDPETGQLFDLGSASGMNHETLPSVWYAVGLLARNNDGDAEKAEKIIQYTINDQFDDPEKFWYGDYTKESEEPTVGSAVYPAKSYGSYDLNWRGFIGLSFITMYEDFGDLISDETKGLIVDSMFNNSIGDSYRAGGVNGDNLYPVYSNPSIMRAIGTGWAGRKNKDDNMTQAGEDYAKEIIDLYDMYDTLAEFNSPTYAGISLWGLTLWCKYAPKDSIMAKRGPDLVRGIWNTTAQLWHPEMRNLAGPWDRSYSFDMTISLGILSLLLAPIVGREESGLRQYPETMSHGRDWAWAPVIAVQSKFHNDLLSDELKESLKTFDGERTWQGKGYSPPHDVDVRNMTTWLGEDVMIGAVSYNSRTAGGPSANSDQFHPAVVQWKRQESKIGWLSFRPNQKHTICDVSPNKLKITFPEGPADSQFMFYVSPSLARRDVTSWSDIQGIKISVSGNTNPEPTITFAGRYGGESTYKDHNHWRFKYTMPDGFTGTPELTLEFERAD